MQGDIESAGELQNVLQAWVPLASFNSAYIGAVKTTCVGKILLRQSSPQPKKTDAPAQPGSLVLERGVRSFHPVLQAGQMILSTRTISINSQRTAAVLQPFCFPSAG